uniref:Uncharacterized protein n=1 Tax=Knipowitschia caucasica TaxID=637954 RepID=A0AAV2KVV6_KNICA
MVFILQDFIETPSLEILDRCRKDDLLCIAAHFGVSVQKQSLKREIKRVLIAGLITLGILSPNPSDPHGEVASEGFEDDQKDVLSEQDVVTEVTPVRVREVANPPGTLPRFEPFSPDAGVSGVFPPGTEQGQASSTAKIKLCLARLQLETEEKVRKADYELKLQGGPSYDSWSRQDWILGKDQTHKVSPTTGAGIDFILGNDLAGSKVVPVPQLVERTEQSTELESPNVFPACAVTRSQSKNTVDLSDSFIATEEFFQAKPDVTSRTPAALDAIPLPATRAAFITAQKGDSSLSTCFSVVEQEGSRANKVGYLMDEGLLMRRWSSDVTGTGDEKVLYQVVVPKVYRAQVLSLAHDNPWGEYGVRGWPAHEKRYTPGG